MRKRLFPILAFVMLLSACSLGAKPTVQVAVSTKTALPATSTPFLSVTSTATMIPPTPTITPSPTLAYPAEGRGPTNFSADVNPLTGLQVKEPENLNRRPIVIKVENIPREHRPQWGLSLADLVYEYYTEFGATRFAAIFYGKDAERVGPIRSGRFFDVNLVQMYKACLFMEALIQRCKNASLIRILQAGCSLRPINLARRCAAMTRTGRTCWFPIPPP